MGVIDDAGDVHEQRRRREVMIRRAGGMPGDGQRDVRPDDGGERPRRVRARGHQLRDDRREDRSDRDLEVRLAERHVGEEPPRLRPERRAADGAGVDHRVRDERERHRGEPRTTKLHISACMVERVPGIRAANLC